VNQFLVMKIMKKITTKKIAINMSEVHEYNRLLKEDVKQIEIDYYNETDHMKKTMLKTKHISYRIVLDNLRKLIRDNG
jgi:hypothetical protein